MTTYIIEVGVKSFGYDKFIVQAESKQGAISLLQNHYAKMQINLSPLRDTRYNHCICNIKEVTKSVIQFQDAYEGYD